MADAFVIVSFNVTGLFIGVNVKEKMVPKNNSKNTLPKFGVLMKSL